MVLAFQINADDSLTFEQVFAGWTGAEVQNAHFGSFMAMNGNTALISYQNSLEIWQFNTTVANGWAQQSGIQSSGSLPGANLVFAIEGDTLITELLAAGASTPTVRIYQENGSTWNQTASFPIDPIAVTISGNTASATDTSGVLHILKQNAAGVWNDIQDINTATSTPSSTATLSTLSATRPPSNNNSPYLSRIQVIGFNVTQGVQTSGGPDVYISSDLDTSQPTNENYLYSFPSEVAQYGYPNNTSQEQALLSAFPVTTVSAASTVFWVRQSNANSDSNNGNPYYGIVQFSPATNSTAGTITDYQVSPNGGATITSSPTLLSAVYSYDSAGRFIRLTEIYDCSISWDQSGSTGAIVLYVQVTVDEADPIVPVNTDIAGSLGNLVAIGQTQGTTAVYAQSELQSGWFNAGGAVTGIALSPDGTTVYATTTNASSGSGALYVLNQGAINPAQPGTLQLELAPTGPDPDPVTFGPGADGTTSGLSSVNLSPNGSDLYVTEPSGAVWMFARNANNSLGTQTLFPASANNLDGVAASATEAAFTLPSNGQTQQFIVTAGAGANTLATFQLIDGQIIADQGSNPDGTDGLGEGDPTDVVTQIQALTLNPAASPVAGVSQVFYAAAPLDNSIFVLNRSSSGVTTVVQRLTDGVIGASGTADSNLAGAAGIAVSPDGQFVYIASTKDGAVAVYERVQFANSSGVTFDGLEYLHAYTTSVFNTTATTPQTATIAVSPDGNNVYVSGPNGLEGFVRNPSTGLLPQALNPVLAHTVSDIIFSEDGTRAYAVSPSTNALLVFSRGMGGALANLASYNTQLDDPESVVLGSAVDAQSQTTVDDQFVYVASAGNNSIAVFDEYSADGTDTLIDGNLHFLELVREGVNGVAGLGGVSVLQESAAINDTTLQFNAAELNVATDTITMPTADGLVTGQNIWFDQDAQAPGGVNTTAGTPYYVRALDDFSFQLFATAASAAADDLMELISLTTANTSGAYVLHTSLPAGAFLYALGTQSNTIAVFARDMDSASPTVGELSFLQEISNEVGNSTGGANDGLYQPNSIAAPTDTVIGNDPVMGMSAGLTTLAGQFVLDQPINTSITAQSVYSFYAGTTGGTITPELFAPVGDLSDPSTLSWTLVASGTPRTVTNLGLNEFETGFPSAISGVGLYFGWKDSGDSMHNTAVEVNPGMTSNAFYEGSGSTTWKYAPGSAYSMQASFGDTSSVFVGSGFDPVLIGAPGGFVTLNNNANDSVSLPPGETDLTYTNISALDITAGSGDDTVTVNQAPTNGTTAPVAIPFTINNGSGADSVTLNDAGNDVTTTVTLGNGQNTFTMDSSRQTSTGAVVNVSMGSGADSVMIVQVAPNTALTVDTQGTTTESVTAPAIPSSSGVSINSPTATKLVYQLRGTEDDSDFVNADGNQLQLGWQDPSTPYGSLTTSVDGNDSVPADSTFASSTDWPVAIIDPSLDRVNSNEPPGAGPAGALHGLCRRLRHAAKR